MKRALIIFGSTTGNTESMTEMVARTLEESGFETEMKEAADAAPEDMAGEHDLLFLGCPAYGDDEIELQEDFEEFFEKWDGLELNDKPCAVFAPGDSTYEHFCGSVDMLEDELVNRGGKLLVEGLKVDGDPDDAKDEIEQWVKSVAANMG